MNRGMKFCTIPCLIASLMLFVVGGEAAQKGDARQAAPDWRSEWLLERDFTLNIDTEGYHLPSAIAFVPRPGPGPKDPLYFVTELRGKIKVVTNDRSVYTFAENFFQFTPKDELPTGAEGQSGLGGICLAPRQGYVFVTFVYRDAQNLLRNDIMRFESMPETFALQPTAQRRFTDVFAAHETGVTHQIGHCQVNDEVLYVGVGDGWQPLQSHRLDSVLGKVLRMTLDGTPVPDNPFYQDDDAKKATNYVWAYGLRNPFGVKIVGNHVFVAENGPTVDRFLALDRGQDNLWDGTDESIATNAVFVLLHGPSPVQVDYYPQETAFFPEHYRHHFFVALAGPISKPGPGAPWKRPGIMTFKYDVATQRVQSVPKYFLQYHGGGYQAVVGLGFGPDGLYFVPLFPNTAGRQAVYKITYNPPQAHPFTLADDRAPLTLVKEKGCFGCHAVHSLNFGGTAGPPLGGEAMVSRIQARLESQEYLQSLSQLDALPSEPYRSYKAARQAVVAAKGRERVRTWIKYRLMEPRFDTPSAQMPNLGLSEHEALVITDYLLGQKKKTGASSAKRASFLPRSLESGQLFIAFLGGLVFGGGLLTACRSLLRRWTRKTAD
jgi:glucose/arabinose dehydrogenase